jgi:hypothetical protein
MLNNSIKAYNKWIFRRFLLFYPDLIKNFVIFIALVLIPEEIQKYSFHVIQINLFYISLIIAAILISMIFKYYDYIWSDYLFYKQRYLMITFFVFLNFIQFELLLVFLNFVGFCKIELNPINLSKEDLVFNTYLISIFLLMSIVKDFSFFPKPENDFKMVISRIHTIRKDLSSIGMLKKDETERYTKILQNTKADLIWSIENLKKSKCVSDISNSESINTIISSLTEILIIIESHAAPNLINKFQGMILVNKSNVSDYLKIIKSV